MATTVSGALRLELLVVEAGELAEGHAVAHRDRNRVDVALGARIGDGTLDEGAVDGIGAVENDDLGAGFRRGFKKITHNGLVGVEANAGVLEVNDDGVELAQGFKRRPAIGVGCAVEADDGQTSGGVGGVGDAGLVAGAANAVLGAEERGQGEPGDVAGRIVEEDVDGAAALAIDAGLVGQQPQAQAPCMAARHICQLSKMIGFEDIDAGLYVAIPRRPAAHAAQRLVIAGDVGRERAAVAMDAERHGGGVSDPAAQSGDALWSVGMNGVGEDDDVGVAEWDPSTATCR